MKIPLVSQNPSCRHSRIPKFFEPSWTACEQIKITITPEGLRIELLESAAGTFFDAGKPNENGMKLLALLAHELGKLPNKILIEGHTDSTPYAGTRDYGNWDLSTDRANAARRLMQQTGLGTKQVSQVRGYADQLLRKLDQPLDASNRRISMIVQYKENEETASGSTGSDTQSLPGVAPKKER